MRHKVKVSIQDFPTGYHVIFIDPATQQKIGRIRRFNSDETVFEMLRRAHANLETINIVEHALRERRPVMVDLTLTTDQLTKLR